MPSRVRGLHHIRTSRDIRTHGDLCADRTISLRSTGNNIFEIVPLIDFSLGSVGRSIPSRAINTFRQAVSSLGEWDGNVRPLERRKAAIKGGTPGLDFRGALLNSILPIVEELANLLPLIKEGEPGAEKEFYRLAEIAMRRLGIF